MYKAIDAIRDTVAQRQKPYSAQRCPLCIYYREQKELKDTYEKGCPFCPMVIITGVWCGEHDKYYHHYKPMEGLSLALALQYYWEKRYCH